MARTRRAPEMRGQKNSKTETSKEKGVFWRRESEEERENWRCPQRRRLTTLLWELMAPLGRPVEPEVKMT